MGCAASSDDSVGGGSHVVIDTFRNPLSDAAHDEAGTTAAVGDTPLSPTRPRGTTTRPKPQQRKINTATSRSAKHRRHPAQAQPPTDATRGVVAGGVTVPPPVEQSHKRGPPVHLPPACCDHHDAFEDANARSRNETDLAAISPPSPQASAQHQSQPPHHHQSWRDRAPSITASSSYWGVLSSPGVHSTAGSTFTTRTEATTNATATNAEYRKWTRSSRKSSFSGAGPRSSPAAAAAVTVTSVAADDEDDRFTQDVFDVHDGTDGTATPGGRWAPHHSRSGSVIVALGGSMIDEPATSLRGFPPRAGATVVASS